MGATTDSLGIIKFDFDTQPGISSLLQIMSLLSGRPQAEVNAQYEGQTNYGDFKKDVANVVKDFLTSFQSKLNNITDEELTAKLEQSEREMTTVANATLLRAQQAVGLRPKVS
jgi:tryptophanyl-tRNA synthetase